MPTNLLKHYLISKKNIFYLIFLVFISSGCTEHTLAGALGIENQKIQVKITGNDKLIKVAYYVDKKFFYDDSQQINEIQKNLDYEAKLVGLPWTVDFIMAHSQTLHILLIRLNNEGTINIEIKGERNHKYVIDRYEQQRHIMYKLK